MSSSSSIVVLRSSDGKTFEVDEVVALESETIRNMIEDGSADIDNILLPNIKSNILSKVIEYCKKQTDDNVDEEELKAFEAEFLKFNSVGIVLAAHYLKIKKLQDLACKAIADRVKRMTIEEIRTMFNIENDFSEEGAKRRVGRMNGLLAKS